MCEYNDAKCYNFLSMEEKTLHDIINSNKNVQEAILLALGGNTDAYSFISEDQYPNGIYVDFTVKNKDKVSFILELKGDDIGVTEYIRGIGQVYEYQHFIDKKMSSHNYQFEESACSVYCFPSGLLKNNGYNIGLFKYPEKTKIIEVNEVNKSVRLISEDELTRLAKNSQDETKVSISQYYIRDTRLYELYICLKYCTYRKLLGATKIDRKEAEINFLRQIQSPDNNNWRNVFISLSSLGLIDSNNLPTPTGFAYANGSYEDFCYSIYESYIKEYIDLLMTVLIRIKDEGGYSTENVYAPYCDISKKISEIFNGKKVVFVTDSDNRYLSSWMNIMRDDFMCIGFVPRTNTRKIEYNICELNEKAIKDRIRKNNDANRYIKKLLLLLNNR